LVQKPTFSRSGGTDVNKLPGTFRKSHYKTINTSVGRIFYARGMFLWKFLFPASHFRVFPGLLVQHPLFPFQRQQAMGEKAIFQNVRDLRRGYLHLTCYPGVFHRR